MTDRGAGLAKYDPIGSSEERIVGEKLWAVLGGEDVLNANIGKPQDTRCVSVLKNLKNLLTNTDIWALRHNDDWKMQAQLAQSSEFLNAPARAADRAAGGGGMQENAMFDQLVRCEAREAFCEQQMLAEQSRVMLLRKELDDSRREVEMMGGHTVIHAELKAREVQFAAKAQCLESMHEDAQREIETLRLQHHVAEVDLGRSRSELVAIKDRQKVLEEELRLLKERPPKAPKPQTQRRASGGKMLDRHDLASRTIFAAQVGLADDDTQPAEADSGQLEVESKASWFSFGCCSATKASPSKPIKSECIGANKQAQS